MLIQPVTDHLELESGRAAINNDMAKFAIWAFYNSNPDRVIVKIGGFLKVRVKDLRILFELLAGPESR